MNISEIHALVREGESERVEFKRSTGQRTSAAKTVCAMLNVFYRAGIIERWGSGTLNIIDWCAENANPPPTWQEQAGSVYITFLPAVLPDASQIGTKPALSLSQVCPKSVPSSVFLHLLGIARDEASIDGLMEVAGQTNRTRFRKAVLRPLLEAGVLEMTIPDKPRSSKQKYRLTEKGRELLVTIEGGAE